METSTRIPVPGTYNFRDVGGLPASTGTVRDGVLFRSDGLYRIGAEGRAMLEQLGIGIVIDLRDEQEAARMPDDLDGLDVEVLRLPVFEGSGASQGAAGISLEALYDRIVTMHAAVVVSALREIASAGERAVLVHCTAGKDRTGVATALLLTAAGAAREAVVADYASSAANLGGPWAEGMYAMLTQLGLPLTDGLKTLVSGSPAAEIERALDWVNTEHGGAAAYLQSGGLTDDELAALRARLAG